MYRCRQRTVALALVLAWVGHVGFVLTFYFCARTLWDGQPDNPLPSLAQHFLIVPVGLVISAVPLFPGGVGIGEAGFGGLYAWFGSGADQRGPWLAGAAGADLGDRFAGVRRVPDLAWRSACRRRSGTGRRGWLSRGDRNGKAWWRSALGPGPDAGERGSVRTKGDAATILLTEGLGGWGRFRGLGSLYALPLMSLR